MPVGFQAINDSFIYQIDGTNRNIGFVTKGSLAQQGAQNGVNAPYAASFVSSNIPIIFYRTSGPARVVAVQRSGTTNTIWAIGASGVAIPFWAFCENPVASQNIGLQVYNDAGQLAFDSAIKPLKIVGNYLGGYVTGNQINTGITNAAYCMMGCRGTILNDPQDRSHANVVDMCITAPGGILTFANATVAYISTPSANPIPYGSGGIGICVADVTGL